MPQTKGFAMSEIKLFRLTHGTAAEVAGEAGGLEKSLQTLLEKNLETMLGVRFVASEHGTGKLHKGRIDTLGLDENGFPVILEYKRAVSENVISQGLYYLDWLLDHKADFKLLVLDRYGAAAAGEIVWTNPRLICVAADFTKHDEHAIRQINRNIDLVRYRRFGSELLALELVAGTTADAPPSADEDDPAVKPKPGKGSGDKLVKQALAEMDDRVRDLYEGLRSYILALGSDITEQENKLYMVYRRIKNFACVVVQKGGLVVYVKVDPSSVPLVPGFTRDVRNVGHWGTGELEINIREKQDLERAEALVLRSYEAT
jgi:predicted transport protein